jgi:hypothetical protein
VVLVPALNIEGKESCQVLANLYELSPAYELLTGKQSSDSHPALAHVLRSGKDEDLERGIESIDTMVKELAKRTRLLCSSTTRQKSQLHKSSC